MKSLLIIPVTIVLLIGFFIYRYFISNLLLFKVASDTFKWFQPIARLSIITLTILIPIFFIFNHLGLSPLVVKISSYALGIFFILFITTIDYLLLLMLTKITKISSIASSQAIVGSEIIILLASFTCTLLAFHGGLQNPEVNEITIQIKNWNQPGYKIAHLSDLHVGPSNDKNFVQKIVTQVNQLKPNMVVITGDLIDTPLEFIVDDLRPLKSLAAPTFAILGNHEFYNGFAQLETILTPLNVKLMINESLIIDKGFNLIAISDPTGKRFNQAAPDFKKAVEKRDTKIPSILLAHQPLSIKNIDKKIDLMLTGHTHGGQIAPFHWLVKLVQPYINGLYLHKKTNTQIYVNPGTGFWGPPMRLGTKAEITLITINPPEENSKENP